MTKILAALLAAAPLQPVEVGLTNGTDRPEAIRLTVYEHPQDGRPREKRYEKSILVKANTEDLPQQVATVRLGAMTEVCAAPVAYSRQGECRTYRQPQRLECRVSLLPVHGGQRPPEMAITCH